MAFHTKKSFAEQCGMTTGNLSNNAARGKVVYSGDLVDDTIEPNKSFLTKWSEKNQVGKKEAPPDLVALPPPNVKNFKADPPAENPKTGKKRRDPAEKGSLYQEQVKKMQLQNEMIVEQTEMIRLKREKTQGSQVPIDLVRPLLLQHNQSIITEAHNTLKRITRLFAKKHDLTLADQAEINTQWTPMVNEMIKKATALTQKSLKNIIHEYSVRRGAGERD